MNEQDNNLIPILSLAEIHYNKVYLSKNDIEQIQTIILKLNLSYIHKVLILSAFMYDCDPNDVLEYCLEEKHDRSSIRQKSNILNARYLWMNLLVNVGDITVKDIAKSIGIHEFKVRYYLIKFNEKNKFGTLFFDKYNAAKEVLLDIK